jgi:Ca-activated chloride channel family protein
MDVPGKNLGVARVGPALRSTLASLATLAMLAGCDARLRAPAEPAATGAGASAMRAKLAAIEAESAARLAAAKSDEERARIREEARAASAQAARGSYSGKNASRPQRFAGLTETAEPAMGHDSALAPPPPAVAAPVMAHRPAHMVADDPLDGLMGAPVGEGYGGNAVSGMLGTLGRHRKPAAAVVAPKTPAPPAPTPRLDPNARYATTYRPGGAALAQLDAALARGKIPAVYSDLVGDFGARYAPTLAEPAAGALAVSAETERALLPPAGGPLHLRVALRSAAAPRLPRARLAVTLVLDVSGSMQGTAIENARVAAKELVERLDPRDHFSLVVFSEGARVVVPAGPIGHRRARILRRIERIETEGGTELSAGLDLGYAQAARATLPDAVRIVMLLSDGEANQGDTDPRSLAARTANAFQDGIQTSTFGLGDSFDAPLLSTLADRGAGGYYYLAEASQIAPSFARELDARLVPAALAVEVRVRLRPDVAATKVYGSRQLDALEAAEVRAQEVSADAQAARRHGIKRDRQHDAAGGMRFFMPSFARADRHALLLALELPPGVGDRPIGSVEVRWKDRLLHKNVTKEIPVRVRYGKSDAESAGTINAGVLRAVQAFAAGDAILAAAARVDAGDRPAATSLLAERAQILERAAKQLAEPRFKEDGMRLARLATAVGGVSDPMALAVLLRGSGSGYLQ